MASVEDHGLPLLDVSGFHKHVSTLTSSQKEFVVLLNNWFRDGRRNFLFVILTGGPGCGKTHAVVETLRYTKLAVTKMSFTARLARRIGGDTVHSTMDFRGERGLAVKEVWKKLETTDDVEECLKLSARLDENMCCKNVSDIVVIDEIGMLPFWLTYRIGLYFRDRYPVEQKRKKPVAMICMGDDRQLRPVMSRLSVFHVDFGRWFGDSTTIEMKESKRFTPEYEIVVNRLRELMEIEVTNEENDPDKHPLFQYVRETYPIVSCVTQEMMMRARFILAFTNESVDAYNEFYLNMIMSHEKEYEFPTLDPSGKRVASNDCPEKRKKLRKNCSVVVTENGCGENICNGTTLKFLDYDRMKDEAICQDEQTKKITRVRRSRYRKQIPLVPGFAVTIHKFQGATIDEDGIIVSFDKSKDFNLIYTALSRVRDMSQIIAVVLD